MPAEARQSLTEKIVQTLDDSNDGGVGGEHVNVEHLLEQVEMDLTKANEQLAVLEDKEEFISVRIQKYQGLLKKQAEHLMELQERQQQQAKESENNDTDEQQQLQQHHIQEQVQKQQTHREALGKVVDTHMDILKHIKDCKRTILALEHKKHELTNVTKKCREFLVMAEEAEREQQLGVVGSEEHDNNDLTMMEMAPAPVMVDEEAAGSEEAPLAEHDMVADKDELLGSATAAETLEVPSGGNEVQEVPAMVEPEELEASAP